MIKVRIQHGQNSIEAEGSAAEVTGILETYWSSGGAASSPTKSHSADPTDRDPIKTKPAKSKTKRASSGEDHLQRPLTLNAQELANRIKQHSKFDRMQARILAVPGDWINKCRMVAYVAGVPITSGDVQRVLSVLRIKCALPRLSTVLSDNSAEFLTNGSNPVKYEFTSPAEAKFEIWLSADEK